MSARIWILGAPGPEMAAIETLLLECGETVAYALDARGERVHPGNAYAPECTWHDSAPEADWWDSIYTVECEPTTRDRIVIDHHRPGDRGYGRPPSEFLAASSIGQVVAELARLRRLPQWPTIPAALWEPLGALREVLGEWAVCVAEAVPGWGGAADYREPAMALIPLPLVHMAAAAITREQG